MKKYNFKIPLTTRNAGLYIEKSLLSLINQKHKEFTCIIIDDCSTDNSWELINKTVGNDKRFILQRNSIRKYGLINRTEGTHKICQNPEDIIVILDGDDWFIDNNTLEYLNFIYQDENIWMTYGQHRYTTDYSMGGSKYAENPFIRYDNTERNLSHLRSYKYWLFCKINQQDFKDKQGQYFKFAEDVVVLYPMAEMAGKHLKFLPKPTYIYNNLNELSEFRIYDGHAKLVYYDLIRKIPYPIINKHEDFKKINIKLYDKEFAHCTYSGTDINGSEYIEWYRGEEERDFVFYTDRCLPMIDKQERGIKVAWLLEPEAISPTSYQYIRENHNKFNYILSHDKDILDTIPNSVFIPASQTWIRRKDWNLHPKNTLVTYIYAEKPDVQGHAIRKEILTLKDKITKIVGRNISPFPEPNKIDILKDSYYCIIAQNNKKDYYFTEHLIDCFLTGTIPIFYGCPSIGNFFDTKGMYIFNTIEELNNILSNLDIKNYGINYEGAIINNFNTAHKYYLQEDYIYNYFIRKILCGVYPC